MSSPSLGNPAHPLLPRLSPAREAKAIEVLVALDWSDDPVTAAVEAIKKISLEPAEEVFLHLRATHKIELLAEGPDGGGRSRWASR
jgi:hypothetical protein